MQSVKSAPKKTYVKRQIFEMLNVPLIHKRRRANRVVPIKNEHCMSLGTINRMHDSCKVSYEILKRVNVVQNWTLLCENKFRLVYERCPRQLWKLRANFKHIEFVYFLEGNRLAFISIFKIIYVYNPSNHTGAKNWPTPR
jgi:hypothetical protein